MCHVSIMWTLVDLFCTKRLFSRETAFPRITLPEIRTGSLSAISYSRQRISYSRALNKVKTGRLRGILNDTLFDRYLKVPDNHRYRRATRNFSGQGGFVKLGHPNNHFIKNSRKKGPAGKNSEVSSLRYY